MAFLPLKERRRLRRVISARARMGRPHPVAGPWNSRQRLLEELQNRLGEFFRDFQLWEMSDVFEEAELIGTGKSATCGIESRLVNDVLVSRDDQGRDVDLALRRRRARSFFARFSE